MRFIDLSHSLQDGLPNFSGDPHIGIRSAATIPAQPCNVAEISMSSHQGTHLDAPRHFYADGRTVDEIPLERFYGPTTLIDLAPGSVLPASTPLTISQFEPHAEHFVPGARILYRTGWDSRFGTTEFFTAFPTLTVEASHWIAEKRIGMLGMDTPTPGVDFLECHLALLAPGVEIVIVEGLAGLERLPSRFTFIGFPLKIRGGDGAPIRAVAMCE